MNDINTFTTKAVIVAGIVALLVIGLAYYPSLQRNYAGLLRRIYEYIQ